ncbi:hypothetical protein BpHYR1_054360 [Brachionus plicatilis]|uniref:Uncharacterized protein n=1 Tax=Brachionus plicatilis TaxID=10195 RepID=A0A3M7REQ9_BRAPC|nr:hypothetical protein BpHYR1_054360 [Brachionus plicatilis]
MTHSLNLICDNFSDTDKDVAISQLPLIYKPNAKELWTILTTTRSLFTRSTHRRLFYQDTN